MTPDAARVAAARRWYRALGYDPIERDGVTVVATPAHPDTWEANWLQAAADAGPDAVLAALARYRPAGWQVVVTDALTPPSVEAALALDDFSAASTLIEMAASRIAVPTNSPPITLTPVGEAEWPRFAALVDIDQREGKRTGEHDEAVAAGLLDGMRRRLGLCRYWLIGDEHGDAGYGMTVACPGGLGLIESLFTLPDRRGRGLMSAFIARAANLLRDEGCDAVFLDAHAHDTPKRLYARLGFAPVAMARTWVRRV